jgi:type II secretory pathway component PulF
MVSYLGYQFVNEAAQKIPAFYLIFKHTNSNVHFGLIIFFFTHFVPQYFASFSLAVIFFTIFFYKKNKKIDKLCVNC